MNKGPAYDEQWTYDTPVHSDVEAKLRKLLIDLGKDGKILGVQVCAYKDGDVIIDTAAGVLGEDDPRPVQPDSLFNVFSVTKGITAGILHWLVDKGKLNLEENVAHIWPEFGKNGKDTIKVHHVLNHTAGLQNAVASNIQENPQIMADYDECLRCVAMSIPETEPGHVHLYHYLSFGWLCAGIIERASGRKLQELLEEVFVHPLKVEGELYIGIPTGVESRLAELTVDEDELKKLEEISKQIPNMPDTFDAVYLMTTLPPLYNRLDFRCAVIPAANAHCSARALARYYAALVDGGLVPPSHSSSSRPPLGSHPHIPNGSTNSISSDQNQSFCKIFSNPRIHDQLLGFGEYENLVLQNSEFGLGFKKNLSEDGNVVGFGHGGMGGFVAFADIKNRFAIAVTINKLGLGTVTAKIVEYVCLELDIPVPKEYVSRVQGPDMQLEIEKPVIN